MLLWANWRNNAIVLCMAKRAYPNSLEKLSTFFSPFKNALKLYIWSALLRLTAPAIQFAILPARNGNTHTIQCAIRMPKVRFAATVPFSNTLTHTHTTHSTCFPSISFYYVILLRAFLQQQTDERMAGTKEKEYCWNQTDTCVGLWIRRTERDHFSKMVNLSQNVELLFYFRSPKVSLLLLFSHSAAGTRLEVANEREEIRARRRTWRMLCFAPDMVWPAASANMRNMT